MTSTFATTQMVKILISPYILCFIKHLSLNNFIYLIVWLKPATADIFDQKKTKGTQH